jgi:hypothetical protein
MATNWMRRAIALAVVLVVMQGCSSKNSSKPYVFMLSDFFKVKVLPYDSPQQVIYRIDDHRFVTLERYRDCYHGQAYYNDTRASIHYSLGRASIEDFQGRLINADPTGRNLVFPSGGPPQLACPDRGCTVKLLYSTDGGRTFDDLNYMNTGDPFEDSKRYTVAVTGDKLFVAQADYGDENGDAYVREYPLVPGIDLRKPYPPGIRGSSFAASKRPQYLRGVVTPSGLDRITCDASIKPTNPDAPLVP